MKGVEIVAERTPEQVAKAKGSFTGRSLAPLLVRRKERGSGVKF